MNINVKKVNEKYYLIVKNYKRNIQGYKIIHSNKKVAACVENANHDLLNNKIDIYNQPLNLLDFSIELEPLLDIKDYYTVILTTDDDHEYPFYIDFNKFYNIKQDEKVYFYEFDEDEYSLKSQPLHKYNFYLYGNFGDKHQIKIFQVVNDNYILFTIPEADEYFSEVYFLIVELNEKVVYKCHFPIIKNQNIEFVTGVEDYGQYLKYTVSPKYNYPFLKELSIKNNERVLVKKIKNKSNKAFIKNISFYLPNVGINNFSEFIISYKTQENYIDSKLEEHLLIVRKNIYNKEEFEINNFKHKYNFNSDIYEISWNNRFLEKLNYKITFDNKYVYYTNNNFINISNIKEKNNYQIFFDLKIECDIHNNFYTLFETKLDNFHFIDSPINFTPIIDYSSALLPEAKTAIIKWTTPEYKYTSKIKIEVDFLKQYLNEYLEPWKTQYILDKEVVLFDQQYDDYNKQIEYDFNEDGEYKTKTVNESALSYKNDLGFIDLGEQNSFEIPIWFCKEDTKYKIYIEIYDRWGIKRGENKVEFSISSSSKEITDKDIWLDRNQYMQFGETGTVGTFYKIENPTPIDVRYAYSPQYKTFKGQALYDYSNVDNKKNSLYYYLNSNEKNKNLIVKFKRNYNFYKLTYEVFYNKKNIIELTEVIPQGNTFEHNSFRISKSKLQEEGEYIMNIRTFSSTNQESSIKEIKFYVYNDKPATPVIEINSEDFSIEDEKIIINKKYFSMNIVNNAINKKYAGWNYKEAHFFFKKIDSAYNEYPDYVMQASKENGIISFKNTLSIENGNYECKVICYDYSGNASDPYIFEFELISHMSATPELLFTNQLTKSIKWEIKKSQDSEGYYRQFKYSSDGINFIYTEPERVDSPYKVKDPSTNQYETINLYWLRDKVTQQFKEGYYQLVIYEWNLKHLNGVTDYKFESPVVEVNEVANPSNPINCKEVPNKVAIFNKKAFNEYAYTNDLDNLIFETIHNEIVLDDAETPKVEGQYYKLQVIEPSTENKYECVLPVPTEVGMYTFDKIATKCNISNQTEGVWEIRFITIDKSGNDNSYKGYYTYLVNLVKRNPKITSASLNNSNGSEYFGLNSGILGMHVETNCYEDISNFKQHIEKFNISKFQISFISTPLNSQYTIYSLKDDSGTIRIMDALTEIEKRNHNKDGRYLLNIRAIDPLNRYSDFIEKTFHIDTQIDCELFFVTQDVFFTGDVNLIASSSTQSKIVYYKFLDEDIDLETEDYKTWDTVNIEEVTYNGSSFNGCQFNNLHFEDNGIKTLVYKIEEVSGNVTDYLYYRFTIDTTIKIAPIFDFDNKVFYTHNDQSIIISWNLSSKDITSYAIKLDKIELNSAGQVIVVKSYSLSSSGDGLLVPVGPNENHYIDWGTKTQASFLIKENSFLVNGLYRLSVKSTSKYGELEVNDFKFQLDNSNMINIAEEINKNTITIDSNRISWNHIINAMYYEISYDNKVFFRTINNYFIVDNEKLTTDSNNNKCVYMRWRSKTGQLSESVKIILNVMMKKLSTPKVEFLNGISVTDNNKLLEWTVTVEDPEIAKYIYYSFDNEKWNVLTVKGKTNIIIDETHSFPIDDGEYGIFVRTTDEHPSKSIYYSKSDLVYSSVKIFAENIEKPEFLDLKSGVTINEPKQLFITNKNPSVDYYIYINGRMVYEGYEISSSTLKKFDIVVKAKKRGIEKIYNLITEQDNFHVWSLTNEKYILNINNEVINCYIDPSGNYIEVFLMPEKKGNQVILYRNKDIPDEWKVLRIGDKLSLFSEWDFHITTFNVLGG